MGCRFSKVEPDNEGSFVRWIECFFHNNKKKERN